MSDVTMRFTIQGDSEGYITFDCPYCNSEFKLQASEFQNDNGPCSDLFCPYCGLLKDMTSFYSEEVMEKAKALAANYMIEQINKSFGGMTHSINRNKGLIKMTFKPLKKVNVKELKEKDTSEVEFECNTCSHHVRVLYCAGASKIFCPYCGVDI